MDWKEARNLAIVIAVMLVAFAVAWIWVGK